MSEPEKGINISFGGQPMPPEQNRILNDVPARARMAMEFSLTMARRASPIIAASDLKVEEFAPAPLTKLEIAAWDASCTVLADYFNGQMEPDKIENQLVSSLAIENTRRRPGKCMVCGVCNGACELKNQNGEVSECGLCDGAGKIIVIPHFDDDEGE